MKLDLQSGNLLATVSTMGGELISLKDISGTEYIWQGDSAIWSGQNPNLFPIIGKLRDGKTRVGDFICEIPKHGLVRRREFKINDKGTDFVEFIITSDDETRSKYPFTFSFKVRHTLLFDGFETGFTVENNGKELMPFCIGAHTGFNCPLEPGKTFDDYILKFSHKEDTKTLSFDGDWFVMPEYGNIPLRGDVWSLRYEDFDRFDTMIFEDLKSNEVSLIPRDGGKGVKVDFTGWPMIAFWTKPDSNAPYLCIEPWQGCAACVGEGDDFFKKRHVVSLKPNEVWEKSFKVTLA